MLQGVADCSESKVSDQVLDAEDACGLILAQGATPADADALFDAHRYAWLPSRAQLEEKRAAEGLPARAEEHLRV